MATETLAAPVLPMVGRQTEMPIDPLIAHALEFTETYARYGTAHKAVREAMCLKTQFPAMLGSMKSDDAFAGRVQRRLIACFSHHIWAAFPERQSSGKQGGYCFDFDAPFRYGKTEGEKAILRDLAEFWSKECGNAKFRAKWDTEMRTYVEFAANNSPVKALPGSGYQVGGGSNGCSLTLDYHKLLRQGIPGLVEQVETRRAEVHARGGDTGFFDGLAMALELVKDVCRHYQQSAESLAAQAADATTRDRMLTIARTMNTIVARPPASLREALQLAWIYSIVNADLCEFPRFDELFCEFYVRDLESGVFDAQGGDALLLSFWGQMAKDGSPFSDRIVVGGRGRKDESKSDPLALAVLRTIPMHRKVTPQFTLRHFQGQNPALLALAVDAIGQGCVLPLLYNDDAILPGVEKLFDVSPEMALRYHPFGCGEFTLAGCSPTPILVGFNIPKALDAALHNGRNVHGTVIGLETGTPAGFDTFDALSRAFLQQVEFSAKLAAKTYRRVYEALGEECSFLLASLLTDDCVARGRAALDGGLLFRGACVVGQGYTNAADALTAIREVVYEKKAMTIEELVKVLDADFAGHEGVRLQLLRAPKFGNDRDVADSMFERVWSAVHAAAKEAGKREGLDYLIVSSVNAGGFDMGCACGATADGRKCGQPFAIGTAPTAGSDTSGLTALLNSLSRIGAMNGGATTNLKVSRDYITHQRKSFDALLSVFFAKGGLQASITSVNRNDLEDAMVHPERNGHVLVRVGGFVARFIDLDKTVREEIIRRTLY